MKKTFLVALLALTGSLFAQQDEAMLLTKSNDLLIEKVRNTNEIELNDSLNTLESKKCFNKCHHSHKHHFKKDKKDWANDGWVKGDNGWKKNGKGDGEKEWEKDNENWANDGWVKGDNGWKKNGKDDGEKEWEKGWEKQEQQDWCQHDWCQRDWCQQDWCQQDWCKKVDGILRQYGSFYTTASGVVVLPGTPINLNLTSVTTGGIVLFPGGVISIEEAGDYFVKFGASLIEGGTRLIALSLNGVFPVPSSLIQITSPNGLFSASTIIHVTQPSTLSLVNASAVSLTLGTLSDTSDVTAFVTIKKLHNLPTP